MVFYSLKRKNSKFSQSLKTVFIKKISLTYSNLKKTLESKCFEHINKKFVCACVAKWLNTNCCHDNFSRSLGIISFTGTHKAPKRPAN